MGDSIKVTMLGGFSISYGNTSLDGNNVRSKKIWMLIGYLITFRFRCVANDELIDILYPEEISKTPQAALKTIIHRARETISRLGYKCGKDIILNCPGGYRWNPEIPIDVDAERFELLTRKAAVSELEDNSRLRLIMEALDLFKGDFLPESTSELWSMSISAYFHFLYIDLVHTVIDELTKKGEYTEIVPIAKKAIGIDPYEESLHISLILALAKSNQLRAAKIQYEVTTNVFYNELGITPSEDLKTLYKKLIENDSYAENSIDGIVSQMKEENESSGAFFCEYELFRDIYRVEVRSAARSERNVHICLISLNSKDGRALTKKLKTAAMQSLSERIKNSLRRGDVWTRYSVSQFLILLHLTSYEDSDKIVKRIINKFQRENPSLSVSISYSVKQIQA